MNESNRLEYVIVTPARNEEDFIGNTIESMISQTRLPKRWIIVSDGSTDKTDQIVKKYVADYSWIGFVRMPDHSDRQFAAKVQSFNAGYKMLQSLRYDLIGNVDADISFEPEYFEFILSKFAMMPDLGVAGTPFAEGAIKSYSHGFTSFDHVSGACQIFRRNCFEQIGGYTPIKGGGIDWAAVTTARMMGWKTKTFPEKCFNHHRKMGTGNSGFLMSRFNHGFKDYYLGGHPIWQIFRSTYQVFKKPYIVGGAFLMAGYTWAFLQRTPRPLPEDLIQFHRAEQLQRLKSVLTGSWKSGGRK